MSTQTENATINTDTEVVVDPVVRQLNTMSELIESLTKTSKLLSTELKSLTKDVNKMKSSKGKQKRTVDPDAPRKLGALEKPVPITDELSDFLGLTRGDMYSRQQITQGINKYVKDNDLQNPENRRYILLESESGLKLKTLLRDPDQPLTFFNIQRYLKVHYPKVEENSNSDKVLVESTSDSTTETKTETNTETNPKVVADLDVVDETETELPAKKKVVRKIVKKTTPTTVVAA